MSGFIIRLRFRQVCRVAAAVAIRCFLTNERPSSFLSAAAKGVTCTFPLERGNRRCFGRDLNATRNPRILQVNPRANHSWRSATCQLRGHSRIVVTEQLLGYKHSMVAGAEITYVRLNTPMPCLPRSTCLWSTRRAPAASFISDVPGWN